MWDTEQLLQYSAGSSGAVLLSSMHGLELKGKFVRTSLASNQQQVAGTGSAVSDQHQQKDVLLFLGSPRLAGILDLKVCRSHHKRPGSKITVAGPIGVSPACTNVAFL